ncbi:MAG TPA: hypothetical protein VI895_01450 [Bdellovibrionota bacterium]|nr:hypothetical protein [Bdellovibrionota bacterium]
MKTTGPGQSTLLLLDAVDILNHLKIPYAVVGAIAAAFHGLVRASQDADVVISLPSGDLPELEKEMHRAGFLVELSKGDVDDPVTAVLMLADAYENRVDLLLGIRGMEAGALSRALEAAFMGGHIRIIGAEDFIAMKIFAGGPKDMDDVRGVLEVSREKLDLPLLKKLTRRYGAGEARTLASLLSKLRR